MKSLFFSFALFCALFAQGIDLMPYKQIICFGDSITHGGSYHMYLQEYLAETDEAHPRKVINQGISGNTTDNLLKRVDAMLKTQKPDLVFIMIGINDLMFTTRFQEENLPFDEAVRKYPVFGKVEKNLGKLLDIFNEAKVKVVVLSPAPYNESLNKGMKTKPLVGLNSTGVKTLVEVEKRVAQQKGAEWIDVYTPMLENLQKNDDKFPRGKSDRVHPSGGEHLIIAQTILGKKYVPGSKKAAAGKYCRAQHRIQNYALRLNSIPEAERGTAESRCVWHRNWVAKLSKKDRPYYEKTMESTLKFLRDPESAIKVQEAARDAAFKEMYNLK